MKRTSNKACFFDMQRLSNLALFILVFGVTIIVLITGIYNYNLRPMQKDFKRYTYELNKATAIEDVAKDLEKQKIIRSKKVFLIYCKIYEIDKILKGDYDIGPHLSVKEIMKILNDEE